MKRLSFLILALLFLVSVQTANGESPRKKYSKIVRKEAKRLAKEGWTVEKDAPSLEEQLERLNQVQDELNEKQEQKYIITEGLSASAMPQASIVAAVNNARIDAADRLRIRMVEDGSIVTQETLTYAEENADVETLRPATPINISLPRVKKVMTLVRKVGNRYEARVVIACDYEAALLENTKKE